MKKCSQCGAVNDNLYVNCIDCGAQLGPPLSKEELKELEYEKRNPKQKMTKKTDSFMVSRSDKIVSMLLTVGAILHLLLMLNIKTEEMRDYKIIIGIVMIWMIAEAFHILNPRLTLRLYQLRMPKQQNQKELQPSEDTLLFHRGMAYFTAFVGYALLIFIIIKMLL